MKTKSRKIKKILKIYHIFIISGVISSIHKLIKTLYIESISKYYGLENYYFEHLSLDYFFSMIIIAVIFLIFLNIYKISINKYSKKYSFMFHFIIIIYYILGVYTIIVNNILSKKVCVIIIILFFIIKKVFEKICSFYTFYSLGLFFLFFFINFSSVKLKRKYEIATLPNYQKVVILTLQNNDYLVAPFMEKDNLLCIKTDKKRWINRLEPISINFKVYQQIKIIY